MNGHFQADEPVVLPERLVVRGLLAFGEGR